MGRETLRAAMRATEVDPAWLHERERGSPRLIGFMIWVMLRLGRNAARALLPPIVLYFAAFSPRARAASRRYLDRALGRRAGFGDVLRHYHCFAATILDRVYFLSGRWDRFDLRLHGEDRLLAILERGEGCILLGAHLGSFEALRAAAVFGAQRPFAMIMDNANAQKAARAFAALNPALAATVIESGAPDSLLRARERLDAGGMVGMLGDRLRPGDKAVSTSFLGAPMAFPAGPFAAAAALGAPVVLCFGLYRGGRRYDLHFEPFRERLALPRATRAAALSGAVGEYAARLEHYARLAPYNWFNFFDVWSGPGGVERK
jgi:predicted LPLAT superfamily acyltransferase